MEWFECTDCTKPCIAAPMTEHLGWCQASPERISLTPGCDCGYDAKKLFSKCCNAPVEKKSDKKEGK